MEGDFMNNFDRQRFAELLSSAKGSQRSINQYGLHVNVSPAHISRLLRAKLKTPPNPETIKKLVEKAYNGITYNQLMEAAGHIPILLDKTKPELPISETEILKNPIIFSFIKLNILPLIRSIITSMFEESPALSIIDDISNTDTPTDKQMIFLLDIIKDINFDHDRFSINLRNPTIKEIKELIKSLPEKDRRDFIKSLLIDEL
jgi:hypothetical protein